MVFIVIVKRRYHFWCVRVDLIWIFLPWVENVAGIFHFINWAFTLRWFSLNIRNSQFSSSTIVWHSVSVHRRCWHCAEVTDVINVEHSSSSVAFFHALQFFYEKNINRICTKYWGWLRCGSEIRPRIKWNSLFQLHQNDGSIAGLRHWLWNWVNIAWSPFILRFLCGGLFMQRVTSFSFLRQIHENWLCSE